MAPAPSDARLWALLVDEFRAAGADSAAAERHARRAVAVVRRERATGTARTFAPGVWPLANGRCGSALFWCPA